MKRKLIKRNKQRINKLIQWANGWPLGLFMYDNYSTQSLDEAAYYKEWNKDIRSKVNRMNGSFEAWFGFAPSRYCVGRKGKIQK